MGVTDDRLGEMDRDSDLVEQNFDLVGSGIVAQRDSGDNLVAVDC